MFRFQRSCYSHDSISVRRAFSAKNKKPTDTFLANKSKEICSVLRSSVMRHDYKLSLCYSESAIYVCMFYCMLAKDILLGL